ncbi:unnamed protein product [Effrenium voratum]|nr:unnamed protein product [Effrenium voratum]
MTITHLASSLSARTSFVFDCSNESIHSLDPDCMRLRDLYVGKEVLGASVNTDCGVPYETENPYKRVKRPIYIHDSRDGLWYHCCEYRPPYGYFTHRTHPPLLKAEHISLGGMAMKFVSGLFKKKSKTEPEHLPVGEAPEAEGDIMEQAQGPLLQCNAYENLKLVQNKAIGTRESLGDMPMRCMGDEAVLLRRFTGGTVRPKPNNPIDPANPPKDTECVDIGPKGTATVVGKDRLIDRFGQIQAWL